MARGKPRKNRTNVLLKSAELLGWALGGIEREINQTKERLVALTAQATQLRSRIGGGVRTVAEGVQPAKRGRRRRRKMSPEARKRISDMMKKRWAERKRNAK